MLIIPISQNLNWRNPPSITLLIIALCIFVFFTFQRNDNKNFHKIIEHYQDSGLLDIEIKYFFKHTANEEYKNQEVPAPLTQDMKDKYAYAILSDNEFTNNLTCGNIINEKDSDYSQWRKLRQEHNSLMQKLSAMKYGFIPAKKAPETYITYMFLHGSFGHLAGNMVFLWLVGCILEIGCGRAWFILLYFLGGIIATAIFGLFHASSHAPLIGASGAISALMGAFAVFFGMKKVKIFFSIGIYFDYLAVFAIILLPFWIANEAFQLLIMDTNSSVAYMAHIGGLAGGAFIGAFYKAFLPQGNLEMFVAKEKDNVPGMINKAVECIGRVDMAGAFDHLDQVLQKDPHNINALKLLVNIHKHNNKKDQYDKAVQNLLHAMVVQSSDDSRVYDTYKEHIKSCMQATLPPELYSVLSIICLKKNKYDEAETLISRLIKEHPGFKNNALTLLAAADSFAKRNETILADKYYNMVLTMYPESDEAEICQKSVSTDFS